MQYSTFFRKIFDSAHSAFKENRDIQEAVEIRVAELRSEKLEIFPSPVIQRGSGTLLTVTLVRRPGRGTRFLAHVVAAGALRIRSNHRIQAYRGSLLGNLDEDRFWYEFLEGMPGQSPKETPPFAIGDLSKTDQALRYLISRAVMGENSFFSRMETERFPPFQKSALREPWPCDREVMEKVLQLESA